MKKKLFTLLTLLVCVCTGAWASTVDDLATISADYTFIADNITSNGTVGLTAGTLYDNNRIFSPLGNSAATNKGSSTIGGFSHYNSLRIKKSDQDVLAFKVSGACTMTVYAQTTGKTGDQARPIKVGNAINADTYGTVTDVAEDHVVEITAAGVVYLTGTGDRFIAGFEIVFPPSAVAPSTPTLTVDGGDVDGGTTTTISSANAKKIYYCWSESSDAPAVGNAAYTVANGASYIATVPEVNGTRYLHAYGWNDYNTNSYTAIKSAEFIIKISDLAIASGKGTQTLSVDGTLTFTDDVDYTTSSTGAISLTSSVAGVVSIEGATITAVGAGKTTITLTQAAADDYATDSVEYTINVIPKDVLDLGNATNANTMFKKGWVYDTPYFTTSGGSKVMIFSLVSANQSQAYQTWVSNPKNGAQIGGASTRDTWSASGIFKGGLTDATTYCIENGQTKPSYTTVNPRSDPYRTYYLRSFLHFSAAVPLSEGKQRQKSILHSSHSHPNRT